VDIFPQTQEVGGSINQNQVSSNDAVGVGDRSFAQDSVGLYAAWELDFWGKFRRGIESADSELLQTVADYDAVLVSLAADVATNYIQVRSLPRSGWCTRSPTFGCRPRRWPDRGALPGGRGVGARRLDGARDAREHRGADPAVQGCDAPEQAGAVHSAWSDALGPGRRNCAPAAGAPASVPQAPRDRCGHSRRSCCAADPTCVLQSAPLRRRARALARRWRSCCRRSRLWARRASRAARTTRAPASRGWGNIFDGDSFTGFIGLQVNWPILNYGRIIGNMRVQDARYEQAVTAYQDTVLRAAGDVEGGCRSSALAAARRLAGRKRWTPRSERVEIALIQYRAGAVDFIRVNTRRRRPGGPAGRAGGRRGRRSRWARCGRTARSAAAGRVRANGEFIDPATAERMRERTDWGEVLAPGWQEGKDLGFTRPAKTKRANRETKSDQGERSDKHRMRRAQSACGGCACSAPRALLCGCKKGDTPERLRAAAAAGSDRGGRRSSATLCRTSRTPAWSRRRETVELRARVQGFLEKVNFSLGRR
jgi:hypothetical protein